MPLNHAKQTGNDEGTNLPREVRNFSPEVTFIDLRGKGWTHAHRLGVVQLDRPLNLRE